MDGKMEKVNNKYIIEYKIEKKLIPIYNHQKSFYNKAWIIQYYNKDNIIIKYQLVSYNTIMIEWDASGINKDCIKFNKYYYNYSNTTLKHVKEFIKQYNHLFLQYEKLYKKEYITKKDILSYI